MYGICVKCGLNISVFLIINEAPYIFKKFLKEPCFLLTYISS